MNKINYIKCLCSSEKISFILYESPIGKIILLMDNLSLKAVLLNNETIKPKIIEKNLKRGCSTEQDKCIKFLSSYFNYFKIKSKNNAIPDYRLFNITPDLSPFTTNEISIYNNLLNVPFGKTISYKELADVSGFPNGSRFAGNTMAKNLFPLFIPCHRVIKTDGNLGNYSGGIEKKRYLLEFEHRSFID